MKALIIFYFLFTVALGHAETNPLPYRTITWEEKKAGGFSASLTAFPAQLSLDQNLTIQLTLTFPDSHKPEWKTLMPHLLAYEGFGAPPFNLLSHDLESLPSKTNMDGVLSQKLTLVLSPQTLGKHSLTFYEIAFMPVSKENKAVTMISGILPIEITSPSAQLNVSLEIAPLMPLSSELPISISTSNRRAFIANPHLESVASTKNINELQTKTIPWQILPILLTLLILVVIIKLPPKVE